MKTYLPGIRYHNENLKFTRSVSEHNSPVFKVKIWNLRGKGLRKSRRTNFWIWSC